MFAQPLALVAADQGPGPSSEAKRDGAALDLTIDDAVARIDALLSAGDLPGAESLCRDIGLQCAPAVYAAGVLAHARREFSRAVDLLSAATLLAPHIGEFHLCLAKALLQTKQPERCATAAKAALKLEPCALAHALLASAYSQLGREPDAAQELEHAVELDPSQAGLWSSLGASMLRTDDLDGAMAALTKATELDPKLVEGWVNLGRAFAHHGATHEGLKFLRKARELAPDSAIVNSTLLFALSEAPGLPEEEVFEEHRRWGARLVALAGKPKPLSNEPDPDRVLRVGYVSGDLRRHPVAFFSAAMLSLYDRRQFDVACYYGGLQNDRASWQLRSRVDRWVDIASRSDDELAELIREDRIDILVDLSGHTAGERLAIFARRSAPIQVTYLGYVNTTGLPSMDYRITDRWTDPPGESERFYTERLLRPFESFVCYAPPAESPEVAEPPVKRTGHITFGSFNRARKINSSVAALWSRVLQAVPGSRLLLKPGSSCRKPLLERFAEHGVADRVDISETDGTMGQYLASYAGMDIALDPFPWNGITTSCDALWMGVPLVALEGGEYRGRAGVSLLRNLDLPQLIGRTPGEFVERAVALSADIDRLAALRGSLRERMLASPIMDGAGFTRALEASYREIWRAWCAEQAGSPLAS